MPRQRGQLRHDTAHSGVAGIVVVFSPRVEAPVHELHGAARGDHPRGARIPKPDAVGGHNMQAIPRRIHLMQGEAALRLLPHRVILTENLHPLVAVQGAHNLGPHPRNRRELPGPIGLVMRPREPGGLVPLPLGGPTHRPRHPIQRFRIGAYASMRRSRRKGQLRRVYSIRPRSQVAMSVSASVPASAR